MSERRCKAKDDAGFWWGKDDPIYMSRTEYVPKRGIFIPESNQCNNVPLSNEDLCYKHSFLTEQYIDLLMQDEEVEA